MVDPFVVPLTVWEGLGIARDAWPVSVGVPFPHNVVPDVSWLSLEREGKEVPFQGESLVLWPNGSVKWMLLDFAADIRSNGKEAYHLRVLPWPKGKKKRTRRGLKERKGVLQLEEGETPFRLEVDSNSGEIRLEGMGMSFRASCCAIQSGSPYASSWEGPEIDASGPLRTAICMPGRFSQNGPDGPFCLFRTELYHQSALLKLEQLVLNDSNEEKPCFLDCAGVNVAWEAEEPFVIQENEGHGLCLKSRQHVWRWISPRNNEEAEAAWRVSGEDANCLWPFTSGCLLPGMARRTTLWCVLPSAKRENPKPEGWIDVLNAPLLAAASQDHYERSRSFHVGWSASTAERERWQSVLHGLETRLMEMDTQAKRGDPCLGQALFQAALCIRSTRLLAEAVQQVAWDADKGTVHHGAQEGFSRDTEGKTSENPLSSRAESLLVGYCLTGELWWYEAGIEVADRLVEMAGKKDLFRGESLAGERIGSLLSQLSAAYSATYDEAYMKAMRKMVARLRSKGRKDRIEGNEALGQCAYGLLCYHWVSGDEDAVSLMESLVKKGIEKTGNGSLGGVYLLAPLLFVYHLSGDILYREEAQKTWDMLCEALESNLQMASFPLGRAVRCVPLALRLFFPRGNELQTARSKHFTSGSSAHQAPSSLPRSQGK